MTSRTQSEPSADKIDWDAALIIRNPKERPSHPRYGRCQVQYLTWPSSSFSYQQRACLALGISDDTRLRVAVRFHGSQELGKVLCSVSPPRNYSFVSHLLRFLTGQAFFSKLKTILNDKHRADGRETDKLDKGAPWQPYFSYILCKHKPSNAGILDFSQFFWRRDVKWGASPSQDSNWKFNFLLRSAYACFHDFQWIKA